MRKFLGRFVSTLAILGMLLAGMPVREAHAAGIVVSTNTDPSGIPGLLDGKCSLREAVSNANTDTNGYTDCTGGSGADKITFSASVTMPISLDLGELLITGPINITGNGAANTIIQANGTAGTATWRVFEVSSTGNLTLDNLTVRNGRCVGACPTNVDAGGGILNAGGALTIQNTTLTDNAAANGGGIYNSGTLTVTNTTFGGHHAGSGGGVYISEGTVTVTSSAFTGNTGTTAGGILNDGGTLTVTDSTFSGNQVAWFGGGIYNEATLTVTSSTFSGNSAGTNAGGIGNAGGTLTVTNSTFSGNSTDVLHYGGAIDSSGALTVVNSTFSGNSAGLGGGVRAAAGTLSLTNTIIANSIGGDCYGLVASGHNNLIEGPGGTCGLTNGTNSNIIGSEPNLGPLQDNGGPTETMALLPGSPAIDAGDDATCADVNTVNGLDQRGVTRPQGQHCDIGAFEVEPGNVDVTVATTLEGSYNVPGELDNQ